MDIRKAALAGLVGLATMAGAATADAAPGVVGHYGTAYGATVGSRYTSVVRNTQIQWDTNGRSAIIGGEAWDSLSDGQYAGLYARFIYTTGAMSDLKLVVETGNEAGFIPMYNRTFTTTAPIREVALFACRRSAAAGINGCATWSIARDNPYT